MAKGQEIFAFFIFLLIFFFVFPLRVFALDFTDRRSLPPDWLWQRINPNPSFSPIVSPLPGPSDWPSIQPLPRPSLPPIRLFLFPGLRPSPSPTADPNQAKIDFMMNQINIWRQSKGLALVKTDPYTCTFASKRAKEVATDFNHAGFNSNTIPYPTYSLIVENISSNSDYTQVVTSWINSSGHAANLGANTPYACVGISGDFYAYEGWKP